MPSSELQIALPKGRIFAAVRQLLEDAGIRIRTSERSYRPHLSIPGWQSKLLKPQSVVQMLEQGSKDLGFTGADWVQEQGCTLVELLDTELDPVRLVVAAPAALIAEGSMPRRKLIVATEYPRLAEQWLERKGLADRSMIIRSFGATEVYPPDDADFIVDNTATGATLRANGLEILDTIMLSSTRLYASRRAYEDPTKREAIKSFLRLIRSVLRARNRSLIEVNVRDPGRVDDVVRSLPGMGRPTVSPLHDEFGYAVKAAVKKRELPALIPKILANGGSDILISRLDQIVVEDTP